MRTKTYTKTVYTLEEVKAAAIAANWDINVDPDWWGGVYYDADQIGLKITAFDLDRAAYCAGEIADAQETAELILKNHGACCDTYKLASQFIHDRDKLIDEAARDENGDFEDERELDYQLDELETDFKRALLEEYRCILQIEYEFLTSEEAIYETLKANEYEFDENGEIA